MSYYDDIGDPYFEIRCEGCGTTFHAGDGDGLCPGCDSGRVSYDATAAREWNEWRDEMERGRPRP